MKLLFDLGNTRLKWALWDGAKLCSDGALMHGHGGFSAQLLNTLDKLPKVGSVWVASVAGCALDAELRLSLNDRLGLVPTFVKTSTQACGVQVAYPDPARLGVDRLLGLIALHQTRAHPVVLVSCGTALVLDAMAGDGRHLGGLIAPSPELMRRALSDGTARIDVGNSFTIVEIADNTADAVHSGTWLAAVSLIERFLAAATGRFGVAPELVLTGGDAGQLQVALGGKGRIEQNLVLRGLAHYADSGDR